MSAVPESHPPLRTGDVESRSVAEVMHDNVGTLPHSATVGEVRHWFSAGKGRRLAVLADGDRYAGAIAPVDLAPEVPDEQLALDFATARSTLRPDTPASIGRDLVFATDVRRMPVVAEDGRLCGVLAVTTDLQFFACRPTPR